MVKGLKIFDILYLLIVLVVFYFILNKYLITWVHENFVTPFIQKNSLSKDNTTISSAQDTVLEWRKQINSILLLYYTKALEMNQ